MTDEEIFGDIQQIIREVRRDDSIVATPDTAIDALGLDSIDFVELLFMIEEKFNIDIPFNANSEGLLFDTVGGAVEHVRAQLGGRAVTA